MWFLKGFWFLVRKWVSPLPHNYTLSASGWSCGINFHCIWFKNKEHRLTISDLSLDKLRTGFLMVWFFTSSCFFRWFHYALRKWISFSDLKILKLVFVNRCSVFELVPWAIFDFVRLPVADMADVIASPVRFARVVIHLKNPMIPSVSTKFIIIFALDIWKP